MTTNTLPNWKDKALFTPGPLTTSRTVKQAMLRDLGSRDTTFIDTVRDVRRRLLDLAEVSPDDYAAVLMQGSGTFAIEAVISSVLPPQGRLLVLVNGAYGERMVKIARTLGIHTVELTTPENSTPDLEKLDDLLDADPAITHVAVVHCETTTGILNPVEKVGECVRWHERSLIVDAMSSFGAYPIDMMGWNVDFLVSSANKCVEGVPGFAFALARTDALLETRGFARSVSLDLLAQYNGLENDGQFRFTPPTHAILAFHQALLELEAEGGVAGRAERYQRNYAVALDGFTRLGFEPYLPPAVRGYTITSFRYPNHRNFDFAEFYRQLSERGQVIYPGKLSHADCFRIGHIGRIDANDVCALLAAVAEVLDQMQITMRS
jgi:2-aminoethylphosphonate-pyruvate transaminase